MTEKARNIEKPPKEKDGTIRKDEHGYRWIFRNGLWYGMCRIEEVKK